MEGECPANTAKNTDWAYKNFESWRTARNQRFPEARCPDDTFSSKEIACEWLCKYNTETRKADGSEYSPHSLYLLLSGIQLYARSILRYSLICLQITSLHPSRIYVIPYSKSFTPKALKLP